MGRSPARSPLPKRWAARMESPWVKPVMAMVKNTLTAVVAPTSRMSDADVDNFVQLRQALEKFAEVLQKAVS